MARLMEKYKKELKGEIKKDLSLTNIMMVPRLEKIVINSGVGEATRNKKVLDGTMEELTIISGQKPSIRRAKKSIAQFRLRAGMPIGVKVTLRNKRMYEFFDRLVTIVIPRMKDFKGLSNRSFDGAGNYIASGRNKFQSDVEFLMSEGVRFFFCQNTTRGFIRNGTLPGPALIDTTGGATAQLIPGVEYVTAGVTAISDLQSQGYRYVQP